MNTRVVRVWPIAEWGEPKLHLIEVEQAVIGLTLCGQPARQPMAETPVSAEDLVQLQPCEQCKSKTEG